MDVGWLEVLKKSRFVHLCMAITFFSSGVIVNLIQGIFYFTLRPFNKILYRKINWYLCYTVYSQLVFMADWWAGSKLLLYIDKEDFEKYYGKEHGYCIMNHKYEIDFLVGWMCCDRIHLLGNPKAYAKKVIQYLPVLGWSWKFSEFVFLERSFDKDKDVINRQITELSEHPDPMWLLLFPEGTRFTPKKHEISLEFAKKNNLPELKHHLLPRTKGFVASLPPMKGKVPAVYDVVLAFKEDDPFKPTMTNLLFGRPVTAHLYIQRIPMEQLPDTEPEQEKWLRDLFVRKDRMLDSFLTTGDFFKTSGVSKVEPFSLPKRIPTLLNMIFWFIAILVPMLYYLVKLFLSGKLLYFSIGAGIILIFYLLMKKTIGMSEIKKGSSYGTGTPKKTE